MDERAARVVAQRGDGPAGEPSGSGDASHQAGGGGAHLERVVTVHGFLVHAEGVLRLTVDHLVVG